MKCPKCQHDNPESTKFCGECGTQLIPGSPDQPIFTETLETPREALTRGTLFAGRYEIIEELGRGGMGRVYRVEDTKTREEIALKLIKPEISADGKTIERFRNELTLARKIRHKNICGMYDLGEDKGTHFITMEYVRGEDLKSFMRRTRQLSIPNALSIANQVCEGLGEAHRLGIVHRDLKPSNIMIDKDGNARIMDFGIARSLKEKGITGAGVMIGTPEYMSPEQVEGKDIDARSDIYSLGIILYEMLTGRVPFEGDTPLAVALKHKSETPLDPRKINPDLPEAVVQLVSRCMEKNKDLRFKTADEILAGLAAVEKSSELRIKRTTRQLRSSAVLASISKRKKRVFVLAGGSLLVAAVLIAVFALMSNRPMHPPRLVNPSVLTTAIGVEDYPSFSPEAGRLAYESTQSGNWDIWVSDIKSGQSINLTEDNEGDDRCPSWSPDGSHIAFLSDREGRGCYLMSHLGGNVRKVAALDEWSIGSLRSQPQWSKDSAQLAFLEFDLRSNKSAVKILNLTNGDIQKYTLPGPNRIGYEYSWSEDGRFITFINTLHPDTDVSQIWTMRLSDGKGFAVTDAEHKYWNPEWSPYGKNIFYISNRGGENDLWYQEINMKGLPIGEPQPLSTGLEVKHFCLSPDGSRIAYVTGREIANIWRIPILEKRTASWKDAEQLTSDQIFVGQAEVFPDGKNLLFDQRLRGVRTLWMMDLETGEMSQLTNGRPREHACGRISKDMQKVVFHVPGPSNVNVWAVRVKEGQPWQVTDHEGWNSNPCWSADGKEIAFNSDRDGNWDIWVVSESGGQERRLTKHPAVDVGPQWSPDEGYVVFHSNRSGTSQLWKIPSEGGTPIQITKQGVSYGSTWSPDGSSIYFFRQSEIWRVSAEGEDERMIADLSDKPGNTEFHPSTDGRYIYFVWRRDSGDIRIMDVVTDKKRN